MNSITVEIEKAARRVSSKRNIYADMVKAANEYIKPEATLNLGEPEPVITEPAPAQPAAPVAAPPEVTLPSQTPNLKITEFEIHPERPAVRTKTPRRNNFGFTLNPIITVSRPKR
ncbi:MAG: hypothetical protein LBM59_05310 [Ruminococcus sp.]|jgi:hypothetical protein|nr:hypothetical protein [Ruminococcus sp.]